jgi:chloramphenicol 3-O phosphotransferase
MKLIFNLYFMTLIAGVILMIVNKPAHAQTGTVIILNGPSGSGKSSIQKEFQHAMMPHLWCRTGIDMLLDAAMPVITTENLSFWQSANPIRWVEQTQNEQGNPIVTLFLGEQGKKVAYAMNSAIAAYAHNGCNVIVDYIAYDSEWLADLQQKLSGIRTYYVAVDISLETLEQREKDRATSPCGHARSHYASVYGNIAYDLRVDSENNSPQEIALQIKGLIEKFNNI